MAAPATRPGEIRALTSLRFCGALLVFVAHVALFAGFEHPSLAPLRTLMFLLGFLAVGFFFVLSGYILAYLYGEPLAAGYASPAAPRYLAARIAKIWPVHLVTLAAAVALFPPDRVGPGYLGKLLANATLTQSMVPLERVTMNFNVVSWSISNEMLYYLLFPLALPVVSRLSPRACAAAIAACVALSLAWGQAMSGRDDAFWMVYINPLARLPEFLSGMLLRRALAAPPRPGFALATALELGLVGGATAGIALHAAYDRPYDLIAWFFPAGLAAAAVFSLEAGALSAALRTRPFVFLGRLSFAFYMVHYLVVRPAIPLLPWDGDPLVALARNAAPLFVVSLALAAVLHVFVELPAQRVLQRRLPVPIGRLLARLPARRGRTEG